MAVVRTSAAHAQFAREVTGQSWEVPQSDKLLIVLEESYTKCAETSGVQSPRDGQHRWIKAIKTLHGNMMPAVENIPSDTSHLLREILQNKGKNLNNNDPNKSMHVMNHGHNPSEASSAVIMSHSENVSVDGDHVSDDLDPRVDSEEDSVGEEEQDIGEQKDGSFGEWQANDSKEAKRARVENILSSMRQVPSDNEDVPSLKAMEVKRPKRKQLQPQQHDGSNGSSEGKYRKVEQMALQEHIRQLQQQLQAVKRKCDQLCDEDLPADERSGDLNHKRSDEVISSKEQNGVGKSPVRDDYFPARRPELDLRHMQQLLQEHDRFDKLSSSAVSVQHIGDMQSVMDSLKTEIIGAITKVVENVMSKMIEKHAVKDNVETKKTVVEEAEKVIQAPTPERKSNNTTPKSDLFSDASLGRLGEKLSAFEAINRDNDVARSQHVPPHVPFPHFPYYMPTQVLPPLYAQEPEQTEALPLIVNTPKKKRTKVTDTRLSPRAKAALLQDSTPSSSHHLDLERHFQSYPHFLPPMLPTSVAIPNPGLQQSDILAFSSLRDNCFPDHRLHSHSPPNDAGSPRSPSDAFSHVGKSDMYDVSPSSDMDGQMQMTSNLTPMHLRKAKLMFFFVRYPSSAILKIYFPDIKFNKNNTAQLVKWFSNFREFYYIQMEKFARQSIAEGCKHIEDIVVTADSELYRVLNLHYNRNNQIEVPETFRIVVQSTLREFFRAISASKDSEPSWKKAIYKVIARMDDTLPEFFKSANWLERLGDA
ncbi:homeobox protein prospero-like [Haliotis asinina]|uniref:homeobox protein prospero-like n=1 Tax=Haliotis asinina TaxID=109174 RepID=UPI003531EEEF